MKRFDSMSMTVEQVRGVFEEVIRVYALWVDADKFWQPYLDFETMNNDVY